MHVMHAATSVAPGVTKAALEDRQKVEQSIFALGAVGNAVSTPSVAAFGSHAKPACFPPCFDGGVAWCASRPEAVGGRKWRCSYD